MNRRTVKFAAAAAAVAIVTFGATTFLPVSSRQDGANSRWWLGSSAAYAGQIAAALENVEALVYREQPVFVGAYGTTHVSGSWRRHYKARDRSRVDQYYNETKASTSWEVPEGNDLICTGVSYEHECYTEDRREGGAHAQDPVEILRFYVQLLGKADRVLGTETFEGKECVGFEISASGYGDNPEEWVDRIWFDVKTKLPVRIEKHGRPISFSAGRTLTTIQEQFEYHATVPADLFTPAIPAGYVNAHPGEIHKAKERQEKGEMEFANVPPGLKDEIIEALNKVKTIVYHDNGSQVTLSRHAWRKEYREGDRPRIIEWYVIEKADRGKTSFDFNDKDFRLTQTIVNFADRTYKVVTHGKESRPRHPMDEIRFVAGLVDRADRILEETVIDGVQCFGVEISAKKYGTNPDGMLHRVWFSIATKLPVRMEFELPLEDGEKKATLVKDRFAWDPALPADTFVPSIPDGFVAAADE